MPTGYTCRVQDGTITELKDYILNCARNFGALVHMREDGNAAEIRYREVSDYHVKELKKAYKKLEEVSNMTDEEIQSIIDDNYEKDIEYSKNAKKRNKEYRNRYNDMIEKLHSWNPPTKDHKGLKEFAMKQLQESVKWDCNEDYIRKDFKKETIQEYRDSRVKYYLRDIEYHSGEYNKELKSVEDANKWIDDLINSLNKCDMECIDDLW